MRNTYHVVPINENFLITRDYNFISLFIVLWKYGNSLDYLYTKGRIPLRNLKVIKFLRIAQLDMKYLFSSSVIIEVPIEKLESSVILKLKDQSYKCINMNNKTITCVSQRNYINTDYLHTLKGLNYEEMPEIHEINDRASYKEEYLNLISLKHQINKWDLQKFDIYKGLDVIRIKSLDQSIESVTYAEALIIQIRNRLFEIRADQKKADEIKIISQRILKKISHSEIVLNNTHGDAWAGNIMLSNNRIRLIDWHDFGFRSKYFDHLTLIYSIVKMRISNVNWKFQGKDELNLELIELSESRTCSIRDLQNYHYIFMLEMIINRLGYYEEIQSAAIDIALNWARRFKEILDKK